EAPERARAEHPGGAAAARQSDHPRGPLARVRDLARARAPDRGARLREAAEDHQAIGARAPAAADRLARPGPRPQPGLPRPVTSSPHSLTSLLARALSSLCA